MSDDEIQRQSVGKNAPALESAGDNPFGQGFWVVRWDPDDLPRVPFAIVRATVRGPAGCALAGYVGTQWKFGTSRGLLNEWVPKRPVAVEPNESITIYWNTASTPAPFAQIYLVARR